MTTFNIFVHSSSVTRPRHGIPTLFGDKQLARPQQLQTTFYRPGINHPSAPAQGTQACPNLLERVLLFVVVVLRSAAASSVAVSFVSSEADWGGGVYIFFDRNFSGAIMVNTRRNHGRCGNTCNTSIILVPSRCEPITVDLSRVNPHAPCGKFVFAIDFFNVQIHHLCLALMFSKSNTHKPCYGRITNGMYHSFSVFNLCGIIRQYCCIHNQ